MTQTKMPTIIKEYWHVVWTTYGTWPVSDQRGDWQALGSLYESIKSHNGAYLARLPCQWNSRPQKNRLILSSEAQEIVVKSLRELTSNDHIAQHFELKVLRVFPNNVQLLGCCSQELLHQTIGRLKSRTSTLLLFNTQGKAGGPRTWSRGFWQSQLLENTAISIVERFLKNPEDVFTKALHYEPEDV